MKKGLYLFLSLLLISCSISEIKEEVPETPGPQGPPGVGIPGENGLSLWYTYTSEDCYVLFQYHEDGEEWGYQEYEEREVGNSPEICSTQGNNGENGYNSLIRIETIEPGADCEHGGKWLLIGLDRNRNNTLEDNEITNRVKWCLDKCDHECIDVYDTNHCSNDAVYVMWIDNIYYYNEDLTFREFEDGTARLYGKVTKHNSNKTYLLDVTFSDLVSSTVKDHQCLTVDNSDWRQYSTITGTMKDVDGSPIYTISIRPGAEPFQVGIGANVTSSENVLSASGWFITGGHGQCLGDFNFNICRSSANKSILIPQRI